MENTEMIKELNEDELRAVYERARQASAAGAFDEIDQEEDFESGQFDLSGDCDENGLPFDPEGMYNSAPLEFEEMMGILWHVANSLHYAATRYDRHSTQYFTLLKELEKQIKQLGSFCVTRAVLEKSGTTFPDTEDMTVKELYCMVSLHFRKCALAQRDLEASEHIVDMNTAGWLFRLAALAGRLQATEEKIRKIKDGKINIESLLERAQVYKDEPRLRRDRSERRVSPPMRARAFPILKSFAKELQKARAEDAKEAAGPGPENAVKTERPAEKEIIPTRSEAVATTGAAAIPAGKRPELEDDVLELKKFLMDEARSRGDIAEAGRIALENYDQLAERFRKFRGQVTDREREKGRAGPSSGKKKRKKNKK